MLSKQEQDEIFKLAKKMAQQRIYAAQKRKLSADPARKRYAATTKAEQQLREYLKEVG